ncbi:LuxR C-terminal-related transcriptional regulator [Kribbella sp. NPDC023972]|uniref:helix-turn-helix transcriptional regulator n=1 Tax=Kribbella sp. NPDC023972 TaxID=3154795 RepID=UPI0033D9E9AD
MGGAMVGREEELALIRSLMARLPRAASAVAVVRGEAGIGKTTLVRAAVAEADAAGLEILSGACAPLSGTVAYGGLDAALGAGRESAGKVFTSLAAGRAWAVESMLRTVGALAERGAVLVVEDVHWADVSTLDFIAYLSRNLPPTGLLVLLTWRDDDTDPERARWLSEQLRSPAVTDVPLHRLTLEETGRQLPECSVELVAAVYGRSAGNPYLNAELARGDAEPSESLRQALLSRLDAVEAPARLVVAAAATLGRALTDDEMLVAASGDPDAVWQACESGLVVREPGRGSSARHPVLAEVAYERLFSRDRRQLHSRMATHLEAVLPARPSAATVAEVAEQCRRADDPEDGLLWSVRAAVAAEQRYAIAEAGHWYAVAASLWDSARKARDDVPEKLALLVSAATHLASIGQPARAMALLKGDLTRMSDASEEVVRAALARCWLGTTVGDTDQALRDVDLAQQLTAPQDELTWARICAGRAMALGTCSRWDEAAGPARTALELGAKTGDTRTVGTAHALLGLRAGLEGRLFQALEHHQTAFAIAHKLAEPEDLALAGVVLTDVHWRFGDPDRAARVAAVVRREVGRLMLGRHWLEDIMDGNVVQALYEAGRWDEAIAWMPDPTEPSDLGFFQAVLQLVHLARGDLAAAEELQAQAASLSERDQPQFLCQYGEARARLLLQTGHPDVALELVLSIAETMTERHLGPEAADLLLVGLEAAVGAAPERLEQLVALFGGAAQGRIEPAVSAVIDAERSRAVGAPDPDLWLIAAREWATIGRPHDEAWAHLRAAEAVLASRRGAAARRTAAEQLITARRLAERLGAAPLHEEIDKLARLARVDTGPRRTAADRTEPAQEPATLTDREQQVLALLADGLTNREIGDALYMSPKTASVHVTHILEKLGVESRVQAAALAVRLGLDKPQPL